MLVEFVSKIEGADLHKNTASFATGTRLPLRLYSVSRQEVARSGRSFHVEIHIIKPKLETVLFGSRA